MSTHGTSLFSEFVPSLLRRNDIQSVVLFGSSAHANSVEINNSSDLDFHIVADDPHLLENVGWCVAAPRLEFCMQAARRATGGVRKLTIVFRTGQVDLVIVPAGALRLVRLAMRTGLIRRGSFIDVALDEMATCLITGYQFLKGERRWSSFYARVAKRRGVRLSDRYACELADGALCDILWVQQKAAMGEIVAAQHVLHGKVVDTNLRLFRELRLRRGLPVPSFGLGRRLECLSTTDEAELLTISARAERDEILRAAWKCLEAVRALMAGLVPTWAISSQTYRLIEEHSARDSGLRTE